MIITYIGCSMYVKVAIMECADAVARVRRSVTLFCVGAELGTSYEGKNIS